MKEESRQQIRLIGFILLFFFAGAAVAILTAKINRFPEEYVAYQADAFLHGRLDISQSLIKAHGGITEDLVIRNGKYYEQHAPLPALILVPAVALFGPVGTQNIFQYLLVALAGYAAYLFLKRRGLDPETTWWLLFAFLFSSVFFGISIILGYCFFIQLLGVALAFFALYEFSGRDRPWIIGLLIAAICATRSTAGLVMMIFFGLETVFRSIPWRERLKRLAIIAAPIAVTVLALAWLNFAKFGSPFDSGYKDSLTWFQPEASLRAKFGLFSTTFIGRNFRYYFYELPKLGKHWKWFASARGISVFLLSPILLWLFALRRWNRTIMAASVSSLVGLGTLLCLYAPGYFQLGPRYVCDFLPLLFLLLTQVFRGKKMGVWPKAAILMGTAANILIAVLWAQAPPFS